MRFIVLLGFCTVVMLVGWDGAQSGSSTSNCPGQAVSAWLTRSRSLFSDSTHTIMALEATSSAAQTLDAVKETEEQYQRQAALEPPPCLARLQTLNEDHFYWTWRSYAASASGDHSLANEYARYAAAARELGDREVENLILREGLVFTLPSPIRIADANASN